MTLEQLNNMTDEELEAFDKRTRSFDESQSLEDYAMDIRDSIYLWRNVAEGRKYYDLEFIDDRIAHEQFQIRQLYEEKEPAGSAAIFVDYVCG